MKLLVVDDEQDVQFLFKQKFRKELKSGEVQIKFAFNGQSALEFIESIQNRTDYYVLTDINMPEMSGTELLKKIKIRYPALKVIMITAYGDEQSYSLALKNGADDYFTKPLEFNLLKEKLHYFNQV
ncbi:MAG: response regulator [Ignavibacteriae bacterium]|nr:response regulator [Ignavibacteriota bacterium]MCB9208570.1 response regulator [Ignavibacteriales bacterium]MCB9258320.1 response regulator [Ignavibacteriales bacterium]